MKRSNASTSTRRLSSAFCSSLVSGVRKRARLDLLAQPHALAVAGDVLDLVGDRAAVGLAQVGQRVGQRRPRHVHAQDLRRDPGHQLRRQADGLGIERRVAVRLRAERVEPGGEVAVRAVGLDDRGRRLHRLQQLLVELPAARDRWGAFAPRRRRQRAPVAAGAAAARRRATRRRPRRSRARPAGTPR